MGSKKTGILTQSDLDEYIVEVVGQSILHSFRTPLTLIREYTKFAVKAADSISPFKRKELDETARILFETIVDVQEQYSELGIDFRQQKPAMSRTKAVDALKNVVYSRVRYINQLCRQFHRQALELEVENVLVDARIVLAEAKKMRRMYEGMYQIASAADKLNFESTDLRANAEKVYRQLERRFWAADLVVPELSVSGANTIMASRPLIVILFQTILENAIRFAVRAESESFVSIEIDMATFRDFSKRFSDFVEPFNSKGRGEWTSIKMINSGPPISPSQFSNIFKLYYFTEEDDETHLEITGGGTGIGLPMARIVCALHGGLLFVDEKAKSPTFVALLPNVQNNRISPSTILQKTIRL